MRYSRTLSSIAVAFFIGVSFTNPAIAQTAPTADEILQQAAEGKLDVGTQITSSAPAIYAQELTVKSTADSLQGSFIVSNTGTKIVGGLSYDVLLLGPAPTPEPGVLIADNPLLYEQFAGTEELSLAPGASQTVTFEQPLPLVPQGEYRIRIQLTTNNGRQLGWVDAPVTLGMTTPYALIEEASISVASTDPITQEQRSSWGPNEGVNVDGSQSLTLTAKIRNTSNEPLTVTPQLTAFRDLVSESTPETTTANTVVLEPQVTQTLTLPITAAAAPGVYQVWLRLQNSADESISNLSQYRYVVRGASASIVGLTVESLPTTAGSTIDVNYTIAGPADRQTELTGNVEVALLDNDEVLNTVQQPVELAIAGTTSNTAQLTTPKALCDAATIRITVRDQNNVTLTTSETNIESSTACAGAFLKNVWVWIGVLLIVLIVLITIIKKRNNRFTTRTATLTLVAAALATLSLATVFLTARSIHADGLQFRGGSSEEAKKQYAVKLEVNTPLHNSTVNPDQPLPYSTRFTWEACGCAGSPREALIYVYALRDGGHISDPNNQNYVRLAQQYETNQVKLATQTFSYFSALTLPEISDTKQTLYTYGRIERHSEDWASATDLTWLNLVHSPACSDGIDNDGDGVHDMSDPGCESPTDTSEYNDSACQPNNTLQNGSFEDEVIPTGQLLPNAFGYWDANPGVSKTTTLGIVPLQHQLMWQYIASAGNPATSVQSDLWQAVALPTNLPAGSTAQLEGFFNRIAGIPGTITEDIDTTFKAAIYTCNFDVAQLNTSTFDSCTKLASPTLSTDSNTKTWQKLVAEAVIPTGAKFVLVEVTPVEIESTTDTPEFDGHFVDGVCLQIVPATPPTACNDDIDNNDPDALKDEFDPACHVDNDLSKPYVPTRTSEDDPECSDTLDNDSDGGRKDQNDPGCHSDLNENNSLSYVPADNNEGDPQCSNNKDDSDPEDTVKDLADAGCHTDADATTPAGFNPNDNDETNTQCSDEQDNDGDRKVDCDDPGCRTTPSDINTCDPTRNNETDPAVGPGGVHETE